MIDNCTAKPSFKVEGNSDGIFGMKYDYEHGFSEKLNQFITRNGKINGTCTCISSDGSSKYYYIILKFYSFILFSIDARSRTTS